MDDFSKLLQLEFSPFGSLTEQQIAQLHAHYELLSRWNQKINLTRITGLEESVRMNYCESLFLAKSLPKGPLRIVDVGSGAGFPGIPVAIYRPDCQVHLVESHQRKAAFLREATRDLLNIRVIPTRAEQCAPEYDWLLSRAVLAADVRALRLAPNLALLTGSRSGTKLPWGTDRYLDMFHVEHGDQFST